MASDRDNRKDHEQLRILLVDDRADHLIALEAVLASTQYCLMTASSGEEALKLILRHDFAVILMDVQMPGMNGFETAQLIKTRESSMHIPIIFITGVSMAQEHVLQGYSVGAIDYILKPFHPETLRLKIEGFVKLYRNRYQLRRQSDLMWRGTFDIGRMQASGRSLASAPAGSHLSQAAGHSPEQAPASDEWLVFPAPVAYGQSITILESISDAFFAVDSVWRFTYVNQEAERQLGISRVELVGRSLWSIPGTIAESRDTFDVFHQALATQSPARFETGSRAGDQWYEIRAYPSSGGLSVYFIDVSERKRMELELQQSHQYFRQIFNTSPSLMALYDADQGIVDINASWTKHTGYLLEEIECRKWPEAGILAEGELAELLDGSDRQEPVINLRIGYLTKLGERREGLLSTELLEMQGRRLILGVITDITERVQMDKQIARLGQLHLVGEMAAGIAHEIRNPMTTVRGFLQLSKTGVKHEYADLMIEELDRANGIITEFLSLAKNAMTNRQPKLLNDIIQTIYPLVQAEATMRGKHVVIELGECRQLLLDEKEIRQLILNMVKNGLDAMKDGGSVTLSTYMAEQAVVMAIADQGEGIPDSILDKIGTPFFTTKETGTGLGLAVCYSIANRHRAAIDVNTGEQGTTFYIKFQ